MYRSTVVFLSRAAVLALALVGSACDNGPGTPTIPTPVLVTETFTGTVTLNGAINHGFSVIDRGSNDRGNHRDRSGRLIYRLSDGNVERRRVHGGPLERGRHLGERAERRHPVAGEPVRPGCTTRTASWSTRPSPTRSRSSIPDRSLVSPAEAGLDCRQSRPVLTSRMPAQPDLIYSSITSSSLRLGRRRPTPRLDERMKCTRYCTSSQPSVESRSICASARLVFECRR